MKVFYARVKYAAGQKGNNVDVVLDNFLAPEHDDYREYRVFGAQGSERADRMFALVKGQTVAIVELDYKDGVIYDLVEFEGKISEAFNPPPFEELAEKLATEWELMRKAVVKHTGIKATDERLATIVNGLMITAERKR